MARDLPGVRIRFERGKMIKWEVIDSGAEAAAARTIKK